MTAHGMLTHKHLYIYNYVLNIAPNLSLPFNFPLISLFFSYPLLFYRNRYGFNILFYGNLQLFRGWQCVVKSRKCNSAGWARTIDAILRKGKCPPKARRICAYFFAKSTKYLSSLFHKVIYNVFRKELYIFLSRLCGIKSKAISKIQT